MEHTKLVRDTDRKELKVKPKEIRRLETIHYIEKKLEDKGVCRMERHPSDGLGVAQPPHKSGHGGKFTWEGPVGSELDPVPAAIDSMDPNFVEDEIEDEEVTEVIIGELEVAKVAEAKEGVSRIEVSPPLQL